MHVLIYYITDRSYTHTIKKTQQFNTMEKIYSKQMESINTQKFKSVIFSQDANPSLISHNAIVILEEQHFVSC